MYLARAIRQLLWYTAAVIVVWSFYDVARRAYDRHLESAQRPITLTILHWGNPAEDKIDSDLVAAYEKHNPRVHVIRINVGDYGFFHEKLKTMMAAGEPPDAFYLPPDILPTLADLKLIVPLDDYIAHEDKAWMDDFFPILRQAFRYEPDTGLFGRGPTWALPKDFTTAVFYCNVDLFEKAGVDYRAIQKNGWTWDEFDAAIKKITALKNRPEFAGQNIYGTYINSSNYETLRNILWTYGGEYFSSNPDGTPNFRRTAFDSPQAQAAMEMIARMRLRDHTAFNSTSDANVGGQEFLNGHIGCFGSIGRWMVPTYKSIKNFRWDVLPVPYKTTKASMIYCTGWGMASACKYKPETYDLIHFMCSEEGQIQQSRAGLSLPSRQSVAYSDDFLRPPPPADPHEDPVPPHDSQIFLDAIQVGRVQQLPKPTEFRTIVETDTDRCIQTGQQTAQQAAEQVQKDWIDELDSPLRRQQWQPMPWTSIVIFTVAVVVTIAFIGWLIARREKLGPLDRAQQRAGFAFIMPWLLGFLLLTLGPMIASLLLSLTKWNGMGPMSEAEYVGSANFRQLFVHDPAFIQSLKVTAYYVLLAVPVLQIGALLLAVLMNVRVRGIAFFRTMCFVPSVVSGVAIAVVWLHMFNNDYGPINRLLRAMHLHAPNWFGVDVSVSPPINDAMVWAVPALVIMGLWGIGGGMIIYLAGLKGISESLYEAATIDGAGTLRKFFNVTLPMLSPLIFYNVVMGIIGSFQIFTQVYVINNGAPGPDNATLFYVLNLYREAFVFHNMGYASAMAWVLLVIVLLLTIVIFRGSRRIVYYEGLKT